MTINRPRVLNAFRDVTLNEMIKAFTDDWGDEQVSVAILRGAGGKAFSSGGDLKEKKTAPEEKTAFSEYRAWARHPLIFSRELKRLPREPERL